MKRLHSLSIPSANVRVLWSRYGSTSTICLPSTDNLPGHQASWQNLDEYGRAQRYHDGVPQYEQSSIDHLTHSFARSSLDDQSSFYHPHSTQPVAPLSSSHPLHSSDASAQYQKDPTVQAIPAPQPKTSYDAPVFQTFQDRKRAKEAAWRAQQTAQTRPSPPAVIAIPPAISREWTPPFSTIAMMGQPGGVQPPLPPSRSNSVSPLPRSPSIPTPTRSPLPTPPPSITPPGGTAGPLRPVPPTIVQPIQATLERSDTVSSVKSLDRMDFSPNGRRPLPRTPVAVNSSKSLDRGLPSKGIDKRDGRRQQPSIVIEEDEDALSQSGYTSSRPVVIGKEIDNPYPPPPTPPPVRMELPDIVATQSNRSPAKFTPLPSFKLPEGDSDDDLREPPRSSPTVALRELPLISVSSNEAGPSTAPTTIQSPGSAIICAGCGNLIIGRIVNAMNQRFHPQCFRCNECGEYLEHVSSYEWHGKAYCHLDYHDVCGSSGHSDEKRCADWPRNSPTIATTAKLPLSMTGL